MVQQLKDRLLHLHSKHTNLLIPSSDFIRPTIFPKQNKELLNSIININHRNMYISDKKDEYNIFTTKCKVVRCDSTEPFVMICISLDYEFVFVTDSRLYNIMIVQYPIQLSQLIGIRVKDQFPAVIEEMDGCTIRVDDGEPCNSVIAEFLENDEVRFLLGDECFSKMFNYFDEEISDNYEYNKYRSTEEIADIRKTILEGKKIYGSN